MRASVEISMYPLSGNYESPILDFIEQLNTYDELEVRTNTMSTQIFGEYDILMQAIQKEMKRAFLSEKTVLMVMKIANQDLSPTEGN